MVLDSYGVDVREFLSNIMASKPPYTCPYADCGKIYKTYTGMKHHLYSINHETGAPIPHDTSNISQLSDGGNRRKGRWNHSRSPSPPDFIKTPAREALTYAEAQRMVEIEIEGRTHRININEPMDIIRVDAKNGLKFDVGGDTGEDDSIRVKTEDESVNESQSGPNSSVKKAGRGGKGGKGKNRGKSKASRFSIVRKSPMVNGQTPQNTNNKKINKNGLTVTGEATIEDILASLPKTSFRLLSEYNPPDAPPRSTSYYRFIDKSPDELDEEVEYDMDEEDCAWLDLINAKRKKESASEVQPDTFELLMDRLEKESYFFSQNSGKDMGPAIDEDAVCCICSDGECQNTNAILFCDMCNLAVHQECYGVPYIPEGQWLCRRCLQSPSRAVDCVLCPNKGGAFKQTDDNRWAHVVCALWIPEVCFANTVFLEPIDSIQNIPSARWKLACSICKQKNVGACIQCHKNNCYVAFHVTCAQQAGLFMKMEAIKEMTANGVSTTVRKAAFCLTHTPTDENGVSLSGVYVSENDDDSRSSFIKKTQNDALFREKMSKARKMLAEKRSVLPVVSIPTIPAEKLTKIASLVNIPKRNHFIQRLLGYWTLKRHSRNGVPLLRRLQISYAGSRKGNEFNDGDEQAAKFKEELKHLQKLRQNLEKARLLVELVRKRERLKLELLRVNQFIVERNLQPLSFFLDSFLTQLQAKDKDKVFAEPVDVKEVPDYLDFIKNPMDFSTMRQKVENNLYRNPAQFEDDFNLMMNNCMTYNEEGGYYYKYAVKLKEQCKPIFKEAKAILELHSSSLSPNTCKKGSTSHSSQQSRSFSILSPASPSSSTALFSSPQKLQPNNTNLDSNSTSSAFEKRLRSKEDQKPLKGTGPSLRSPGSRKRSARKSGGGRLRRANSNESVNSSHDARSSSFPAPTFQSDSFKHYRNLHSASESDLNSESSHTSSASTTGSTGYTGSSTSCTVSSSSSGKRPTSRSSRSDISTDSSQQVPLEPLDLVWAKCSGYPWYPALIVDPNMPKSGYYHNGVPIPVPPDDVLRQRGGQKEPIYLVLFFDAKRTWQWLNRNKLEPLGYKQDLDTKKLNESKKSSEKKAVRKAYEKAIDHRCKVTGTVDNLPESVDV
ncbi:bromodomain-containing protein 140 [Brevipalpus obovatus]|uniref:bromodomain-containing protein 140 n=1 Tax=Brevipalpus obovatus TaxID=246614 RepID=UPI003D9EB0AB